MPIKPLNKKLDSFPVSIVEATATYYNKSFHSKIFTLFASSESEIYTFSQEHKPHYDFCFAFMKNDEAQWYLDIEGINKVRNWVIDMCKRDPTIIFKLHEEWAKEWEKYLSMTKKLNFNSDEELYNEFKKFYTQYLRVGSVAYLADSFMSTGTEDWLESLVSEELSKIGVKKDENINLVRKLTSPVHFSFTIEAEHKMLILANKIIQKSPKDLDSLDPELSKELKELEDNFHWIQNNYYNVHYINAEEFYNQIKKIIAESSQDELKKMLIEKESHLEQIRKEREELMNSLALSDFIKNILEVARLFAKWKDVRKSGVYIGMYYFDKFLDEVSKRTDLTKEELNFLVFDEIEDVLLKKKDMKAEVENRRKQCFFAINPEGYYITSDADKYFKFSGKEYDKNVTQIRGVVASPGHARGRVRIIRKTEEMAEFKTGEILVTNQTTPDFVPIMKKAAAIVTEQGGITSHAAIVSRELKKPCVIGTKIATSALMNGEVVEVDANNGIIRRSR